MLSCGFFFRQNLLDKKRILWYTIRKKKDDEERMDDMVNETNEITKQYPILEQINSPELNQIHYLPSVLP